MSEPLPQAAKAIRKLDEILAFGWDPYTVNVADHLRMALGLMPMPAVLDKVPGKTVGEKAKAVGISRATWYVWCGGEVRPNRVQAARLQKLTGIKAEKIQGRR
jgi:hypothetical protein